MKIKASRKEKIHIIDKFRGSVDPYWTQVCTGGGEISIADSALRLSFTSAKEGKYTDSQIDDYTMLPRSAYSWHPPLRMTVRARSSLPAGKLQGTGGFGFWNNPFSLRGEILALPEAIWFFYASQPSNMALVPHIPGYGWKAQVVHTKRLGALTASIPLVITAAYGKILGNDQAASHWMQKVAGAYEAILDVNMTSWHTYVLEWYKNQARFFVDNKAVLYASHAPIQPLGFVVWLDNQYTIATPLGVRRFGTVSSGPQWLEIQSIEIQSI